jgi:hypothetical protein
MKKAVWMGVAVSLGSPAPASAADAKLIARWSSIRCCHENPLGSCERFASNRQ